MGRPLIDLTGQKFGRLTVIELEGRGDHCTWWKCLCECGKQLRVRSHLLRAGSKSCGCLRPNLIHGHNRVGQRSPEYAAWDNMRARCSNPDRSEFHRYGGRGIRVCQRWIDGDGVRSGFEYFLADMGHRPSKDHSIDRVNNDGNYEPQNCRWATLKEQRRNMSSNRLIELEGRKMTLVEACEQLGIKYHSVRQRLYRGKTFEQAIA